VSRDWCIVLEHSETATADEVDTVEYALRMREPPFDFDREGDDYFVYADAPHGYKRTQKAVEAVVSSDQIRWLVSVRPASAFVWREVRAELAGRGRPVIDETNTAIRVGAADEEDARSLIADLVSVESVGGAEAERLGRLRRWLLREALIGNYAGPSDPTLPP